MPTILPTSSDRFDDYVETADFIRNPFPYYAHIRANNPIQWSEKWKCWAVFDYESCCDCLKDPKQFSNVGRITGLFHSFLNAEQMEQLQPLIKHYSEGLINIDPPEHRRLRKILQKVFMPSVIKEMAGSISQTVDGLLDKATADKKTIDLIHEFSHPLPVTVISGIFGVPADKTHLFTRWSAGIVRFMQSPNPTFEDCLHSQEHLLEMRAFLKEGIAERQRVPQTDLLGLLVDAEDEGERLTDDEILSTSVTILLGGHETTTRLIANTVYDLLQNPDQLQLLRDDPELMAKAVEEFVRYSGPFHRDQRVAACDLGLHGHAVKKGDYILMMLQSANRDPATFEDPETMRVERNPRKHIGFGSGPHVCLGAHLARLEVSLAMNALLARCSDLRLVEEPEWTYGFLRGPKELRLAWG